MKTFTFPKMNSFILLMLFCINAFAQQNWDFGNKYKAYIGVSSPPLMVKMHPIQSLQSSRFVSRVGGVAFLSVAEADSSIWGQKVKLQYKSGKPDGHRLNVIIGQDTFSPFIPDWQLIPIVKFANSDYNSCVSLFGPKTNSEQWDITFHPAFKNTLLGMRVLQADMMLIDMETFWQLPTINSKVILGAGESLPDSSSWIEPYEEIENILSPGGYQSWVMTDDEVKVKFKIVNDEFVLEGYPYYYFWQMDYLDLQLKRSKLISEYDQLVREHNEKVTFYNIFNRESLKQEIYALKSKIKKKENEIENIDAKVTPIDIVTSGLKNRYDLLLKVNPPVFTATQNIMQYAAFFRYVRKNNMTNWTAFYNRCSSVHIKPSVQTPTRMPKK